MMNEYFTADEIVKQDFSGLQEITEDHMDDLVLKTNLANYALQFLREGVDYDSLDKVDIEVGYLYIVKEYGVVGLMKFITDKAEAYFNFQGERIERVAMDDDTFDDNIYVMRHVYGGEKITEE